MRRLGERRRHAQLASPDVVIVFAAALAALPAAAHAQADPTARDSIADTVKEKPAVEPETNAAGKGAKPAATGPNLQAGYIPGYRQGISLGLSPYAPLTPALPGGLTVPFAAPTVGDDWVFNFWGYMSAALRVGEGTRLNPTSQQYETTFHTFPRVVDAYGMFNGTNAPQGSWVDLTFEYGNNRVTAHVKMSTWKPTVGSDWVPLGSQNFFQQAYLTYKLPVGPVNLKWNVGAFQNVYGGLGQYDVGRYNAAIIGNPFGLGETLTLQYDLDARHTLFLEDGFMGRLGKTPFGAPAVVSIDGAFNPSLPSAWVHHAHAGIARHGVVPLVLGLHYLYNFAQDERDQIDDPRTPFVDEGHRPDPNLTVLGADFRMIDNYLGNFAVAVSWADAHDATLLTGMNYFGAYNGEQLTKRYLGPQGGGTGKMLVTGIEYNVALGRLLRYPVELSPNGPEVFASFFADFVTIDSKDPDYDGRKMWKAGTEWTWRWLSWLQISARYDHVAPNSKDLAESFDVISPKLLFKSDWLSHETVTLAYTHWFYGAHTHAEFPNDFTRGQLDSTMYALTFGLWW
ncbi:MAG TPA: hypothetical protein VHK47_23970 [Polyangia bacterium]|nr:hypothetical protein [Polyangia bacterium]